MKKQYPTVVDESAEELSSIIVSGGKIGVQMELKLQDLLSVTGGKIAGLTNE
jgi:Cys-tRNA(Pro)/Cys-tRNA(Cys) deacylase